jgi:hypothetical protein
VRKRMIGLVMLASFATVLSSGGCFDSLQKNVWRGFGYSLGAFPANFITNYFATLLGIENVQ